MFFEKYDLIVDMLLDGEGIHSQTDRSKVYFSTSQIKGNNFWKSRAPVKTKVGKTKKNNDC